MKKRIFSLLVLCMFMSAVMGCAGKNVADRIISEHKGKMYLVMLGEGLPDIQIDGVDISVNCFYEHNSFKEYKLILLSESYVENIDSIRVDMLKNRIEKEGYWVFFYTTKTNLLQDFAVQFGRGINIYNRPISMVIFPDYKGRINGCASYVVSSNKNRNIKNGDIISAVKDKFRAMIENRYFTDNILQH